MQIFSTVWCTVFLNRLVLHKFQEEKNHWRWLQKNGATKPFQIPAIKSKYIAIFTLKIRDIQPNKGNPGDSIYIPHAIEIHLKIHTLEYFSCEFIFPKSIYFVVESRLWNMRSFYCEIAVWQLSLTGL